MYALKQKCTYDKEKQEREVQVCSGTKVSYNDEPLSTVKANKTFLKTNKPKAEDLKANQPRLSFKGDKAVLITEVSE